MKYHLRNHQLLHSTISYASLKWSVFFSFLMILQSISAKEDFSTMLDRVDRAIAHSDEYTQKREGRINTLKNKRHQAKAFSEEEYMINNMLFDEYRAYMLDSAIFYQSRNVQIAIQLRDLDKEYDSKIKLAYIIGTSGMYKESIDLMETIDASKLSPELKINYLFTYLRVYNEQAFYTQDKQSSQAYWKKGDEYTRQLLQIVSRNKMLALQLKEDSARNAHNFPMALKLNDVWLENIKQGSPDYALATFHRSLIYQWAGQIDKQKYYLALSAISDIESAIKDQASLRMLAQILFEEGDIDRAYNYIRFSWNATVFYNAKLRALQTASILSIIDKTYQAKIEKQKSTLQDYIILASSLLVLLLVALFIIFRQMGRLSSAKKKLQQANSDLSLLNEEQRKLNGELTALNQILNTTNLQLSESNKLKEEYIGRFIELCSIYINKIDDFRKKVNKTIKAGDIKEAQLMTQAQDIMDEEYKELYANFDMAFLQLFPDFVEKVNEFFHEHERIVLKKGELLNPELRIMALMRLGISDGNKISMFLRYSLTTVYNYRTKTKNRTFLSKEDLDVRIMHVN